MMCTVGTVPKQLWSLKNQPMSIDRKWVNSQSTAVIAAISKEGGVDLVQYFKRSVDRYDFANFLKELKKKYPDDMVCLFFDQLRVHTSHHVKDTMTELGFRFQLNAAYFPDGNGIEYIFSKVK